MRKILSLVFVIMISACAHNPAGTATSPFPSLEGPDDARPAYASPAPVSPIQPATVASPAAAATAPSLAEPVSEVTTETGLPSRGDLDTYENVSIQLSYADITVDGARAKRAGAVDVKVTQGDASCKVTLVESEDKLVIMEAPRGELRTRKADGTRVSAMSKVAYLPKGVSDCHFSVDLSLHESAELGIALKRGSVSVENWDDNVQVKMEWGDVDVAQVGALDVVCGECTVTGSGINGQVRYALGTGNVGIDGLVDSVDGKTLGDTILKWRKVKSDSAINLLSRAGDVILSFPHAVPLVMNLKAPRGEIYSGLTPSDRGIPLSVTAEQGNLKLLRQ